MAPSTPLTWANTGPESKLKCLRKKLLGIETLAAKLNSGLVEDPEPELWLKVAKIPLLEKEIRALEKVILYSLASVSVSFLSLTLTLAIQ